MFRYLAAATVLFLLVPIPTQVRGATYGKGVHLDTMTAIASLLSKPDQYVGQRVKVSGRIIEVCPGLGCWLYLAGDRPHERIQVKVTNGGIIFPMEASGRKAVVEGIVEELTLTRQTLIRYKKRLAEESGRPFDPATVGQGTKFIRIIVIGAEIEN